MSLPHCEVTRRLRFLSEPELHVMVLRRGLAGPLRSVAQTAAILDLSSAQVRALDSLACAKLRHPSTGGAQLDAGHQPVAATLVTSAR